MSLLMTLGVWLAGPMFKGAVTTGDFQFYVQLAQDYLHQSRSGVMLPMVGQTEFLWNGFSFTRPWLLLLLVGTLDTLTGSSLSARVLLTVLQVEATALSPVLAYLALLLLQPERRWAGAALAALYATGPGVLAAGYTDTAFPSMLAQMFLPLGVALTIRALERHELTVIVGLGVTLSVILMAHPYICFWLIVVLGLAVLPALIDRSAWRQRIGALAIAALVGGACSLAYVVQLRELGLDALRTSSSRFGLFPHQASLSQLIPHAFLPLPEDVWIPGQTTQQLGYSLWLVLAACVLVAIRSPASRALRWLLPAILVGCLVPLFEIPILVNIVALVLGPVAQATAPVEARIYPVFAAAAVVGGALALPAVRAFSAGKGPVLLGGILSVGIAWNLLEAHKVIRFGQFRADLSPALTHFSGVPEYAPLTAYAAAIPGYAPLPESVLPRRYGITDPVLDNALQDANQVPIGTNLQAARASRLLVQPDLERAPVTGQGGEPEWIFEAQAAQVSRSPLVRFAIEPGKHYLFTIEGFLNGGAVSLLTDDLVTLRTQLHSPLAREMIQAIWTSGEQRSPIRLSMFMSCPPEIDMCRSTFQNLTLREYDPTALPVVVQSLFPYRASIMDGTGLLLETHRAFVPGYQARVNGASQQVFRSQLGRVLVPLAPGFNEVLLEHTVSPNVIMARWVSLVASVLASLLLLAHFAQSLWRRAGSLDRPSESI